MKVDSAKSAVSIFAQQDWDAGPIRELARETGKSKMAVAEPGAVPGWTAVNGRWSTWLRRREWARGYLLMSPTLLVMVAMLIVPMIALVIMSFWTQTIFDIDRTFTLDNYWKLIEPAGEATIPTWMGIPFPLEHPVYRDPAAEIVWSSPWSAPSRCILLAYPMAYFLAFRVTRHKMLWLILITIPFWTSYLLRVFAWKIDARLQRRHQFRPDHRSASSTQPLEFLLYNPIAVVITLAHAWVAFAILPIYVSLEKIDRSLLEAATDLGDGPWSASCGSPCRCRRRARSRRALLVFIPTVGDYVTPTLVGGPSGIDGRQRHPEPVRQAEQRSARRGAVARHDAGGRRCWSACSCGSIGYPQDASTRQAERHADRTLDPTDRLCASPSWSFSMGRCC